MGFWPIILFIPLVSASFLDFIEKRKELPAGPAGRNQTQLDQLFPYTNISAVQQRLAARRITLQEQLKLDNKTQKELGKRLKKYKQKPKAKVREQGDSIHEINKKTNVSLLLYQGDIVLTVPQAEKLTQLNTASNSTRDKRQAYVDRFYPTTTWGRTMYYYFDASIKTGDVIHSVFKKAVTFWQTNTCVNFEENPFATNRVKVFRGQGCYSYIGRIGGEQELSLGSGCDSVRNTIRLAYFKVGTAAHELGHALGFFHLQSRYDRDDYITVNVQNIEYSYVDQFDKETSATNNNYGMPYDYGSIMQYGGLSASRNGKPTMVAKDIKYQDTMGSDIVGFYDVSMMNEYYQCKANCNSQNSATCANGGFPNPRQCGVCICPSGYGGNFCSEKPGTCGKIIQATNTPQLLTDTIGQGSTQPLQDFSYCYYWIQAPAGKKVQITMKSFSGYFTDGCPYGGVEIKTQADQKLTGYRYCSKADAGIVLNSTANTVPIITYNRILTSTMSLEYKIAPDSSSNTIKTTNFEVNTLSNCTDIGKSQNCIVLQYFGYCKMPQVQKRCRKSCQKC